MSEPTPPDSRACRDCGGHSLYRATASSGGGYGPILLPGLGRFLKMADFHVVVCADCGLTRFYAVPEALAKLRSSSRWSPL